MSKQQIRYGILGGQEGDLPTLGELHKRRDVQIAFVYDPDPQSVGMEIAEILGIDRITSAGALSACRGLDYVVVGEPRERFGLELDVLASGGARVLSRDQAFTLLGARSASAAATPRLDGAAASFSVDEALAAFERLFDRERLLDFLLEVAVEAGGAQAGSIMLYSEDADELYIAYASGLSDRVVRNTRQKVGEGIAGLVAKERQGKLIRRSREQTLSSRDRERSDIQSAICVPLLHDDRLLGVLNVSAGGSGAELTRAGFERLERLSGRISRVLSEALKLQETRVRHQELSLRRSVGELSERGISAAAKFSVVSSYLGDLLGADTVEIFVGTHEGDWLVLGGSNRRLSTHGEYVRCDRGALSRAFLERRTIILTESADPTDQTTPVTSVVFVPLHLGTTVGVLMLEFADRRRLEECLAIKDSVALELSRLVCTQRRERRLQREATALGKVSEGTPTLLTCRTMQDLCDYAARLTADALECERVSVRAPGSVRGLYEDTRERSEEWIEEDCRRYQKLERSGESYQHATLSSTAEGTAPAYRSVMAVPIRIDGVFSGGIIAYDRRASEDLDDATFTQLDRTILEHIVSIVGPLIRGLTQTRTGSPDAPSYDVVLVGNATRLRTVLDTEMARADRYHHSFSLLVFKVKCLERLFEEDATAGLALVEEVTRGIQTRTRKTDFGTWIRRDTFAMLSLEGTKRVKFLVSRLLLYLLKDFMAASKVPVARSDFLVGHSTYPGTARTPEAMLAEAEGAAAPQGGE